MLSFLASKRIKSLLISTVISVLLAYSLDSVVAQTGSNIKAAFIEKFTHFIEWPDDALDSAEQSSFQICVVGDDPIINELHTLANLTKIKNRPVKVQKLQTLNTVADCALLYISRYSAYSVSSLVKQMQGKGILTIANSPGYTQQGVMLNFYEDNNQLRFEINHDAAKQSGFLISARLLKVARIIRVGSRQ